MVALKHSTLTRGVSLPLVALFSQGFADTLQFIEIPIRFYGNLSSFFLRNERCSGRCLSNKVFLYDKPGKGRLPEYGKYR